MTTNVFYDTEFVDDGRSIDLISIGIVTDSGRTYYAVNGAVLWSRVITHSWLNANVVPYLPTKSSNSVISLDYSHPDVKPIPTIRRELTEFFSEIQPVELWAYYSAYDHVALAQIFGKMLDLPSTVPMYTNDLRSEMRRLGVVREMLPDNPNAHNALEDAKWNLDLYNYLQKRESNRSDS